jgi:hypothetical protein
MKFVIIIMLLLASITANAQSDTSKFGELTVSSSGWASLDGIVPGITVVTEISGSGITDEKIGQVTINGDTIDAIRRAVETARKYQHESETYNAALLDAIEFITDFDPVFLQTANAFISKTFNTPLSKYGKKIDKKRTEHYQQYLRSVKRAYPTLYK